MDETIVGAMSIMKTSFSSEELILLFGGRRGTQEGKKQRVEENFRLLDVLQNHEGRITEAEESSC